MPTTVGIKFQWECHSAAAQGHSNQVQKKTTIQIEFDKYLKLAHHSIDFKCHKIHLQTTHTFHSIERWMSLIKLQEKKTNQITLN